MIKWGWMRKKGSDRRNWSDRWVILNKSGELKYCGIPLHSGVVVCACGGSFNTAAFRYYKTPQDTNCQGSLNVLEYCHVLLKPHLCRNQYNTVLAQIQVVRRLAVVSEKPIKEGQAPTHYNADSKQSQRQHARLPVRAQIAGRARFLDS
jgi:hypothetical protein